MQLVLILGTGLLGLFFFRQWAQQVGPARARAAAKRLLIIAAGIGLVVIVIRTRGAALVLLPLLAPVLLPWLKRWLQGQGHTASDGRYSPGGSDNAASRITTAFFDMRLDHASGKLSGRILSGQFQGRTLAELDLKQLLTLAVECRADTQSIAVLEAYLDQEHPDWREQHAEAEADSAGASSNTDEATLSRDDAYAVLGLEPGASRDEIRAAHRRLMQRVHPDHGGSDYLAARINAAKAILLDG